MQTRQAKEVTAAGQLLFKFGLNRLVLTPIEMIMNYPLILGFLFYGLGAVLLIIALKYGELSVLYPVISLSFVFCPSCCCPCRSSRRGAIGNGPLRRWGQAESC